ncbi:MAG: VanZ family protein [Anaerovoracaceae bacterium]|jgi:glycopeptide antibiotics resistance protein
MPVSYVIDVDTIIILFFIIAGALLLKTVIQLKKRGRLTKTTFLEFFLKTAFWGYLTLLTGITLLPVFIPPQEGSFLSPGINIIPFYGWTTFTTKLLIINISGNLLLFVPWFILGKINNFSLFEKTKRLSIITLLIILSIEFLQYIEIKFNFSMENRSFDITDIILNYGGFFIGIALYKIYEKKLNRSGNSSE